MGRRKKRSSASKVWAFSVLVADLVLCAGLLGDRMFLKDAGAKKKRNTHFVMLKPPPPPKIKEKPPEPEVKKPEVQTPEEQVPDEMEDQAQDDTPPGDELGLDADGTSGSDAFGLKAKKGGRALIGGDLGRNALLRKYAWYHRIIQEEIREKVHEHMEENGGIPEGDFQTLVEIELDARGHVVNYRIRDRSGNRKMDTAVQSILGVTRVSEPPPHGMPKSMKLKISSRG
jgi:outer membrane biosynthesis protein TonB